MSSQKPTSKPVVQQMPFQMQQQMPVQQMQMPMQQTPHHHGGGNRRIPQDNDPKGTLSAVICTVMTGSTYDPVFSEVPQKAEEGFRVSVFQLDYSILPTILKKFQDKEAKVEALVEEIFQDIAAVEPDSVVFNFECCSGMNHNGGYHFSDAKTVFALLATLMERKHMAMFSDFAMKALIEDWNEQRLGPNPFLKIGEFNNSFDLVFNPSTLKECPSGQLVKVGELCEKGSATVKALGGTLAYTVNYQKADNTSYKVEVLTVATRLGALVFDESKYSLCKLGNHKGAAGHVLLTYPSGGTLLASCGHWIELVRLDVSMENLLKVATTSYGAQYSEQIQQEIQSARAPEAQREVVQKYAKQFVTQSAPSKYSKSSKS